MRDAVGERPKLALLTNILAPYRVPLFDSLADRFQVTVFCWGKESNRDQWKELEHRSYRFVLKRTTGFTLTWMNSDRHGPLDTRYLHVSPALILELLRLRPAAIVSIQMGAGTLVALAYGRLCGCPVWVWWGGTLHTERGISRGKHLFRTWLARRVRRWFSYGETSTEYLASIGVAKEAVVELQNCVPEEMYRAPQARLEQFGPRPVVLCVGQLVPRKGVDLLLEASARLQAEGCRFSLVLVGGGPERARLEQRARELSLQNICFHSPETPERMPAIYRSADVLVFPTREDVWGLVVNEALWSGLPALVSIYAGCAQELVPAASTFDPLDPVDFTQKLRAAITGAIPSPDYTRLRTLDEVSLRLRREVERTLRGRRPDSDTEA